MSKITIDKKKVTQVVLLPTKVVPLSDGSDGSDSEHAVNPGTFAVGSLALPGGIAIAVAQWEEGGYVFTAPMSSIVCIRSGETPVRRTIADVIRERARSGESPTP